MSFLIWRVLPIVVVVWAMRGSAVQYTKYFKLLKNSSYYTMTYIALNQYVSSLESYWQSTRRMPPDVADFLRTNFSGRGGDTSKDAWGTPFELKDEESSFMLTSCGPDHRCENEDDLAREGSKLSRRGARPVVDMED